MAQGVGPRFTPREGAPFQVPAVVEPPCWRRALLFFCCYQGRARPGPVQRPVGQVPPAPIPPPATHAVRSIRHVVPGGAVYRADRGGWGLTILAAAVPAAEPTAT